MFDWLLKFLRWLSTIMKPDDWGSFFLGIAAFVIFFIAAAVVLCLVFVICGMILWEPPSFDEEEFASGSSSGDGNPVHA